MIHRSFNKFLYKNWRWAYLQIRKVRVWFYEMEEDYPRRDDAIKELHRLKKEESLKK